MSNVIFIVGPTATGKTEVAFDLAKRLQSDVISCDSMVVYKEVSIVTSKPSVEMLQRVTHHFVDIISVTENYSVFDYCASAAGIIQKFYEQKKPVIVCGGSGLYVRALLDGIFEGAGKDEKIRQLLSEQIKIRGNLMVYDELKKIDPTASQKISVNDSKRIIRALEVYYMTGKTISEKKKETKGIFEKLPIKIFGLTCERPCLYERINKRVDEMFVHGAVDEIEKLLKLSLSETARKIIGLKEIGGFIKGEYDIERAKELMMLNTRHFAKRQVTWFKPDKRIEWVDVKGKSPEVVGNLILSNLA